MRLFILYFLLLIFYAVFSYSLTAPNLVLSSWEPYWNFQSFMWETFFNNRQLLTCSYLILISSLFLAYLLLVKKIKDQKIKVKSFAFLFFILCLPLLFSNNALSYDVFNYMFNAKEVILYRGNPHIQIPLDFPQDDWLRFMHNTHTPAPYGYGWTAISLIPYVLGMGKFLPTWVIFRLTSFLSIILLFFAIKYLAKKLSLKLDTYHYAILFLNPLFLIEIISNSHNDLWMMAPALTSLALVNKQESPSTKQQTNFKFQIAKIFISLLLLIFSISIKLSTLVLVPIWLFLIFKNLEISNWKLFGFLDLLFGILKKHVILLSSILLFIPLFTERSKQFLPWYLLWSLVWIPLIEVKIQNSKFKTLYFIDNYWVSLLLIFSFTAMLRYTAYLWFGTYEGFVPLWQKFITWSALPIYLIWLLVFKYKKSLKTVRDL
ncbi:MAG: hypothetical protein ABFQ62_00330 [Patescibacteria group bacterium]